MIVKKVVTESADKFQRKMTKLPSFFISLSLLKIFSLFPVHKGQNTWGWPSDLCKLQIWSYHPTPPYTEQSLRCAPNPQCGLEWPVSTPPCIIDLILQHPVYFSALQLQRIVSLSLTCSTPSSHEVFANSVPSVSPAHTASNLFTEKKPITA